MYDVIFVKHTIAVDFSYLTLRKKFTCWCVFDKHTLCLFFLPPTFLCTPSGQNTPTVCLQVPISWPCRPKIAARKSNTRESAFFYSYGLCVQMESSTGVTLGQLVREATHATAQWMWCHINLAVRDWVCVCMNAPITRLGGDGDILGRLRQIFQTQSQTLWHYREGKDG